MSTYLVRGGTLVRDVAHPFAVVTSFGDLDVTNYFSDWCAAEMLARLLEDLTGHNATQRWTALAEPEYMVDPISHGEQPGWRRVSCYCHTVTIKQETAGG